MIIQIFRADSWMKLSVLAGEPRKNWPMDVVEFFKVVTLVDFFEVSDDELLLSNVQFRLWNFI